MRRWRRNAHDEQPTINLTPLIDVVFVILIMFIVIAPLIELEQIALATGPQSGPTKAAVQEQSPLAIYVRADNSIWYQNQSMTLPQLTQRLSVDRLRHPGVVPQLYQDKHAHFGTYQSVKNGIEAAGFEQLDLILNPG